MGKVRGREMLSWAKDEYQKFSHVMMDKPLSYYAFEMHFCQMWAPFPVSEQKTVNHTHCERAPGSFIMKRRLYTARAGRELLS